MRKLSFAFVAILLVAAGYLFGQSTTTTAEPELKFFTAPKHRTVVQTAPAQAVPALPAQTTLFNDKLALRVQGTRQGRVVGTLLVNQNGRWTEVVLAPQDLLVRDGR